MKSDKRNAVHITQISSSRSYPYKGKSISINPNEYYYLGNSNNSIVRMSGLELESSNSINDDNIIVKDGYSFYVLFDNKGLVGVTSDNMDLGSKLKSSSLMGIIGTDDLSTITIKGGNGKVQKLGDWVLRKRASYIQMSSEGQPDIEIKVNI